VTRDLSDEGSATVWTIGICGVVLVIVYSTLLVCVAIGTRHRVEAAADLAALAGAQADQAGGDGCTAAARVAAANVARLSRCVVLDDRSVVVDVELRVPGALARWGPSAVRAVARAGP
jgi:secretion/DNA translocation related TadE-like protein